MKVETDEFTYVLKLVEEGSKNARLITMTMWRPEDGDGKTVVPRRTRMAKYDRSARISVLHLQTRGLGTRSRRVSTTDEREVAAAAPKTMGSRTNEGEVAAAAPKVTGGFLATTAPTDREEVSDLEEELPELDLLDSEKEGHETDSTLSPEADVAGSEADEESDTEGGPPSGGLDPDEESDTGEEVPQLVQQVFFAPYNIPAGASTPDIDRRG